MVNCKDFLGALSFVHIRPRLDDTYCINLPNSITYFFRINIDIFSQFILFLFDNHNLIFITKLLVAHSILFAMLYSVALLLILVNFWLGLTDFNMHLSFYQLITN